MSFFAEFNWTLIVLVLLVSAFVAYVGDVVGMKIGKKRITLWNIRPRYTSRLITLLTGAAISSVTLIFASFASDTVRTALFSMKYVQNQVVSLTEELQSNRTELSEMGMRVFEGQEALALVEEKLQKAAETLKKSKEQISHLEEQSQGLEKNKQALEEELAALKKERKSVESAVQTLREESHRLKAGLRQLSEGRISVFSGELLSQAVITPLPDPTQIQATFDELTNKAEEMLLLRLGKSLSRGGVVIDKASSAATIRKLNTAGERSVLRLVAKSNSVEGQEVVATIRIYPSRKIYSEGDLLAKEKIAPGLQQGEAADILYSLLRSINKRAVGGGILPDPLSGSVGNLDSILFFEAVEQMTDIRASGEVRVLAERDIYSEGPVFVTIAVGK